ncbi:MAG: SCP2 sterol-binding domain-containing protein [Mesorhizobium sp.]|jgi:putative sterol carrier protein
MRDEENPMGIQDVAEKIRAQVESGGFEHSVKFDTGADGVIVIDGATISTTDGPADCTITLSLDDLESLISGDLNPTMAFMSGKLKIDGDMSVAMALSQLIA